MFDNAKEAIVFFLMLIVVLNYTIYQGELFYPYYINGLPVFRNEYMENFRDAYAYVENIYDSFRGIGDWISKALAWWENLWGGN